MKVWSNIQYFAQTQPDKKALIFDANCVTYEELCHAIKEQADMLDSISDGQRVALTMTNPLATMIAYFAVLLKGGVPCVCDFRWPDAKLREICAHYHINYQLNDDGVLTEKHKYNHVQQVTDLLHIGFTSGTTGIPKAYYRGENSWIASYKQNEALMVHPIEVIVAPGPLAHSLSLYACVFALYTGRTFIGQQHFETQQCIRNMQQNDGTFAFMGVPTMLQQLVNYYAHIPYLHYIFSTGDKLHIALRTRIQQLFSQATLIEFFGSSEASFISYNIDNSAPAQSVGKVFPNVKVQIVEPDNEGIGLLYVNSDMVFDGYVDASTPTKEWITIGDYAHLDTHQYLFLHGRENDRLIIGGKNVYPMEIEKAVVLHPDIEEAVIISRPHAQLGELAILLYTGSSEISYTAMKSHLITHLARYQVPSKVVKVPKMTYTHSGKIARAHMKERYLKGEFKG